MQCVHFLGIPEGDQALAQIAIYLSITAKSDAAYQALNEVRSEIQNNVAEPVPLHLRNAPTRAMKEWGYGKGYQHAHQFEDAMTNMECLPPLLKGREFYRPLQRGSEIRFAERLTEMKILREKGKN
jgi:putative ATPase